MNGKTKALIVITTAVVICMLVYSPLTQATQTEVSLGDDLALAEIEQYKPERFPIRPRTRFAIWFLKNAEATEVEGTVVALVQRKLIINMGEEQIRVIMPRQWAVNDEVLTLKALFDNLLEGQVVTVKVLEANVITKEGLRIYILVGYELSTDSGDKAITCLGVNIEE